MADTAPANDRNPEPLWRAVLGDQFRSLRRARGETLAETAGRAGVSPQYLSEVERGRKDPSSEMIAALAGALDTTLIDLTHQVAEDLRHLASGAGAHAGAYTRAHAGTHAGAHGDAHALLAFAA